MEESRGDQRELGQPALVDLPQGDQGQEQRAGVCMAAAALAVPQRIVAWAASCNSRMGEFTPPRTTVGTMPATGGTGPSWLPAR